MRWYATCSSGSRYLELVAITTLFAAMLLAIVERYVASIIALMCGIAVLSYLSERGSRCEK
ncbi:MAG: hypothetical protein QXG17_05230 [Sulfolobales archaeon]